MSIIKAANPARVIRKDETYNKTVFQFLGNGQVLWMPDNNETYIREAFYYNPDVYAAVKTIVDIATTAPINLYTVKNKKKLEQYKGLCKGVPDSINLKERAKLKAQAIEEIDSHPALDLLKKPNEWQSGVDFMGNRLGYKLITGNYYVYMAIPDSGLRDPLGLYILPSQYMQIVSGGLMEPVKEYKNMYGGQATPIAADKIIHNRDWSLDYSYPGSHLFGVSPLKAAAKSVRMSNDGRAALTKMLQNGGARGVLSVADGANATPEQLQGIKDGYHAEYGGTDNYGKIIVTGSKMQWSQMGLSAIDLSLIEGQKWSQEDICKVFKISSIVLGNMNNSTDNNYKHARVSAITNAVIPLLISDRDSLNQAYLPKFKNSQGLYFDYDYSVFTELQEDREKQVNYLAKSEWLTPNEKRIEMGYDEIEGDAMNKIYFSGSVQPIEKLLEDNTMSDLSVTEDYNKD